MQCYQFFIVVTSLSLLFDQWRLPPTRMPVQPGHGPPTKLQMPSFGSKGGTKQNKHPENSVDLVHLPPCPGEGCLPRVPERVGGKVEDECPGGKTNVRRPCPTGPVIRPAGYVWVGKPVWAPGILTPMRAYPLRFAARKRGGPSARHSLVRAEWRPCTPRRRGGARG